MPPAVNTTSPGSAPSSAGDLLAGLLERGLGRPGGRVAARRVAERRPKERRHRRDRLGPHRRGRGVVEVGAGRHHGHRVYERTFRGHRAGITCHDPAGDTHRRDHATAPRRTPASPDESPPRAKSRPAPTAVRRTLAAKAANRSSPSASSAAHCVVTLRAAPGRAAPSKLGRLAPRRRHPPSRSAAPASPGAREGSSRRAAARRSRRGTPGTREARPPSSSSRRLNFASLADGSYPLAWVTANVRHGPTGKQLAAQGAQGRPRRRSTGHTPEGIAVKPLYTAADLEGLETVDALPGFEPVRPRRAGDDVRQPAVDDPPVRRLLHRRGVERVLPGRTSRPGRWGCRSPSTSRRTAATTATTRASSATSARPASRSTRSRT